jgi:hypothetical protein
MYSLLHIVVGKESLIHITETDTSDNTYIIMESYSQ